MGLTFSMKLLANKIFLTYILDIEYIYAIDLGQNHLDSVWGRGRFSGWNYKIFLLCLMSQRDYIVIPQIVY